MGAARQAHGDLGVADGDPRCRIQEAPKELAGPHVLVAPERPGEEPIDAAADEGEQDIEIDIQGHGRGEGVQVKEVNTVGEAVFDEHPLGVAGDQRREGTLEIVREEDGRFLVAQVSDQELPERSGIVGQGDPLVHDARRLVLAVRDLEVDAACHAERGSVATAACNLGHRRRRVMKVMPSAWSLARLAQVVSFESKTR